jgi:hypothetical protein
VLERSDYALALPRGPRFIIIIDATVPRLKKRNKGTVNFPMIFRVPCPVAKERLRGVFGVRLSDVPVFPGSRRNTLLISFFRQNHCSYMPA